MSLAGKNAGHDDGDDVDVDVAAFEHDVEHVVAAEEDVAEAHI